MAEREIKYRTCPLCEAMCGLELHIEDDEVKLIRPDRDDVWSQGFICPKGTTLGHLHSDPDRLRAPLVKRDGEFVEVSWDEAFEECERLLRGVIDEHGIEAVTAYIGNPTVHNYSLGRYVGAFTGMAGLPHIYSAGTVDQWPKNVSSVLMYGNSWLLPTPDIRRTDYFLCMGANPHASQGSLLACPDVLGEMDKIRDRGGKCVVIDPRRTGTVDHADEWLPIVPGTDAAFLLAIANVIIAGGHVDFGTAGDHVKNFEALEVAVEGFTPEAVADTCGIPAEKIREVAADIVAADSAAIYGRIGLCNQEFGTLASWMIDVLAFITGNFDTPGGTMFGTPIAWPMALLPSQQFPVEFGRWSSRVRGAPEVLGQVPVSCLSEEISTPGKGQLKALVSIAGNPVISSPESAALDEALPLLDCMISIDNWVNETSRHAHVILPGCSALEQPHYDEMIWSWAASSAGRYSEAIFPPDDDRPQEWQILLRIAAIFLGMPVNDADIGALDDGYFSAFVGAQGLDPETVLAHYEEGGPDRMCDLAIRTGPWGDRYGENPDGLNLEKMKAFEHGVDFGPMVPRLPEILQTPDQMVDLAPDYIVSDIPRLVSRLEREDEGLVLVSRRDIRSNNSWMHNVQVLVKGKDRCTLLIHPDDAATSGVEDGSLARVSSESGTVEVTAEVTDDMMRGVVCLPHGWGHDKDGVQLSVASENAGVNNNLLAPGHLVDVISGNAIVNGIPVEVVPA